jgi:acyl dehydratase
VLSPGINSDAAQMSVPAGLRLSTLRESGMLHAAQKTTLHQPLLSHGSFQVTSRIASVADKGTEKGAVVVFETTWRDRDEAVVATSSTTILARGDGGFSGPAELPHSAHSMPSRVADISLDIPTLPHQALLYRLCGDYNPLHCDPEFAKQAGFERPILHGLCTYGISCRAVLKGMLSFDSDAIASHEMRFSAPVYPGDILTFDLWEDERSILFEAHVKARNVKVIRAGKTVLR